MKLHLHLFLIHLKSFHQAKLLKSVQKFFYHYGGDHIVLGQKYNKNFLLLELLIKYANVFYQLPKPVVIPHRGDTQEVCISSLFHELKSEVLKKTRIKPMEEAERVIDDFKFGFRDWYTLNGNHLPLWQHWTRKVTDPKWRGPKGAKLALTIQSEQPNVLGVVLHENTWRRYRGKNRTYVAEVKLKGGKGETVTLDLGDFKSTTDGSSPKSWAEMDQLGICAKYEVRRPKGKVFAAEPWKGGQPVFKRLEWRVLR